MTSCAKWEEDQAPTRQEQKGRHAHTVDPTHICTGSKELRSWGAGGALQGSSGTHQVVPGATAVRRCPKPVDDTRLCSHPGRCRRSAHGKPTNVHRRVRMRSWAALGTRVAHADGSVQLQRHRRLPNGCQHPPNVHLKHAATHGNVCWAHPKGPDRVYLYVTAG